MIDSFSVMIDWEQDVEIIEYPEQSVPKSTVLAISSGRFLVEITSLTHSFDKFLLGSASTDLAIGDCINYDTSSGITLLRIAAITPSITCDRYSLAIDAAFEPGEKVKPSAKLLVDYGDNIHLSSQRKHNPHTNRRQYKLPLPIGHITYIPNDSINT